MFRSIRFALLLVTILVPIRALAKDAPDFSGDQTGTNPINFTFDARLYNEYQWLNTEGDGNQNITTFEYRCSRSSMAICRSARGSA